MYRRHNQILDQEPAQLIAEIARLKQSLVQGELNSFMTVPPGETVNQVAQKYIEDCSAALARHLNFKQERYNNHPARINFTAYNSTAKIISTAIKNKILQPEYFGVKNLQEFIKKYIPVEWHSPNRDNYDLFSTARKPARPRAGL